MSNPWCPICNHAAHGGFPFGCQELAHNGTAPCGCTFNEESVARGEADIAAGRVKPLAEVIAHLKAKYP